MYRADLRNIPQDQYAGSMDAVRDVIERRVNLFGVAEPLVAVERSGSEWRLIVELAGVRDINTAIQLIGETPFLEFRELSPQAKDREKDPKSSGTMSPKDFIATNDNGIKPNYYFIPQSSVSVTS